MLPSVIEDFPQVFLAQPAHFGLEIFALDEEDDYILGLFNKCIEQEGAVGGDEVFVETLLQ